MTEKQKLFCKYYIQTKDYDLAAKNAGYVTQTGLKLLQNKNIKDYIEKNMQNECVDDRNIAKSDEIVQCLTRIMRGEEDIIENEKSCKGISVKEKLKAAELLGKMYAIFSPKQEKVKDEPIYIIGDDLIEE